MKLNAKLSMFPYTDNYSGTWNIVLIKYASLYI